MEQYGKPLKFGAQFYIILQMFIVVKAKVYDFNSQSLTSIPNIPSDATDVNLLKNKISEIPPTSLANLDKLIKLSIAENLFVIFPDLSDVGDTLEILNAARNRGMIIPESRLCVLSVIRYINLKICELSSFPSFKSCGQNITKLDLDNNKIEYVSKDDMLSLHSLEEITFGNNQFKALPEFDYVGDTLKSFTVFQNYKMKCTNMSDWLERMNFKVLEKFSIVQISCPYLSDISKVCTPNLTEITITTWHTSTIEPFNLEKCTSLRKLRFERNALTTFPDVSSVGNILEVLNIAKNQIQNVSSAISSKMTALIEVNLGNNYLTDCPDFCPSNLTLKTLTLSNNQIVHCKIDHMECLGKTKSILLNQNRLTYFPDVSLSEIDKLDLSNNKFTSFPILQKLGITLNKLILSGNKNLKSISKEDMKYLISLNEIDLTGTGITSMPDFGLVPMLKKVVLSTTKVPTAIESISAWSMYSIRDKEVKLEKTQLKLIPNVCPTNQLKLYLQSNSKLDICSKEMAWLKQNLFKVYVTNSFCAELNKNWKDATAEELQRSISAAEPGTVRAMLISPNNSIPNTFCDWPPSQILYGFTEKACQQLCLSTSGCFSYNYNDVEMACAPLVQCASYTTTPNVNRNDWRYVIPY